MESAIEIFMAGTPLNEHRKNRIQNSRRVIAVVILTTESDNHIF
jgi:hypothetical protein